MYNDVITIRSVDKTGLMQVGPEQTDHLLKKIATIGINWYHPQNEMAILRVYMAMKNVTTRSTVQSLPDFGKVFPKPSK
jgi:hypothetical protein